MECTGKIEPPLACDPSDASCEARRNARSASRVQSSVWILLCLALSFACVQPDGALEWPQGQVLLGADEEIETARAILMAIDGPDDILEEMSGGVVLDGLVREIGGGPSLNNS